MISDKTDLKVAIVHDWLNQRGGAELVLDILHEMYPSAPIYTAMYAPDVMPASYRKLDIRTSFIQRLPLVKKHHQPFLPLYPFAFNTFDLSGFDVVISNSSGFCHGIPKAAGTCHINYCLTPPRFLWGTAQYVNRERMGALTRNVLPLVISPLRKWDARHVCGVDYFIGISKAVVERIRACYGRDADLIYPPVETSRFKASERVDDYFLVVSRLVPYKRVDLAVKAFSELGLPLTVVGDGRDRAALQEIAGPNVKFTGHLPGSAVTDLFSHCRGFVFPGEEDFGIAPLEAQASGRPVIAFGAGGALETVIDGASGVFFNDPSPESLIDAVRRFDSISFDSRRIQDHARQFDTAVFKSSFAGFVDRKLSEFRERQGGG